MPGNQPNAQQRISPRQLNCVPSCFVAVSDFSKGSWELGAKNRKFGASVTDQCEDHVRTKLLQGSKDSFVAVDLKSDAGLEEVIC